jgi:hypothetical protein
MLLWFDVFVLWGYYGHNCTRVRFISTLTQLVPFTTKVCQFYSQPLFVSSQPNFVSSQPLFVSSQPKFVSSQPLFVLDTIYMIKVFQWFAVGWCFFPGFSVSFTYKT